MSRLQRLTLVRPSQIPPLSFVVLLLATVPTIPFEWRFIRIWPKFASEFSFVQRSHFVTTQTCDASLRKSGLSISALSEASRCALSFPSN